jgi:hypothetical protein
MAYPFVRARWFKPHARRQIDLIVIHTMEAPEKGETAERVAKFFQTTSRPASAHYCVDSGSIVQCVRDQDEAAGAPGANHQGLHVEHAGSASQSAADWSDTYSDRMLRLSAQLVAEKAREYDIPVAWLSPTALLIGKRGITSHANVSAAWKRSTHTDPGRHFPVERYLEYVRDALGIQVRVDGERIDQAGAYLEEGHAWAWVRPIAEALKARIGLPEAGAIEVSLGGCRTHLPVVMKDGRAYVPLAKLEALGVRVTWDPDTRTVEVRVP